MEIFPMPIGYNSAVIGPNTEFSIYFFGVLLLFETSVREAAQEAVPQSKGRP